MREKLIDIVEYYADFLDWDTKEDMVDSIMEKCFATDNNVGSKWIPVTERLPEKNVLVLCIGARGGMFLGTSPTLFSDGTAYFVVPNARRCRYATYWMPLPEPPKGE